MGKYRIAVQYNWLIVIALFFYWRNLEEVARSLPWLMVIVSLTSAQDALSLPDNCRSHFSF